jgi:hypothetical protein
MRQSIISFKLLGYCTRASGAVGQDELFVGLRQDALDVGTQRWLSPAYTFFHDNYKCNNFFFLHRSTR